MVFFIYFFSILICFLINCSPKNNVAPRNITSSNKESILSNNTKHKSTDKIVEKAVDIKISKIDNSNIDSTNINDEQKIIEQEVERLKRAAHEVLPELESVSKGEGNNPPLVKIKNESVYQLTVWFAGLCSKKVIVPPTKNIELSFCPGNYVIAAKLDTNHVKPFIAEETMLDEGSIYSLTFYIMTPEENEKNIDIKTKVIKNNSSKTEQNL